jgi:hypothetical protein
MDDHPGSASTEHQGNKTSEDRGDNPGSGKNPHAVALGRLGGLKGGKVAAANMTPEQRQERARKAALARWRKKKKRKKKGG